MEQPLDRCEVLKALQDAIVASLTLADALELRDVGVHLDSAHQCVVTALEGAGLADAVRSVPVPGSFGDLDDR